MTLTVGGDTSLSLAIPIRSVMHLVLNRKLTVNLRNPEPGTLGVFGIGVGLMKDPDSGAIALGPDKIQPGLELHSLRVLDTGEVRLQIVTIMARPDKILNLSLDPIDWSLDAADTFTSGATSRFTKPVEKALDQLPGANLRFDPVLGPARLFTQLAGKSAARELGIHREQFEKYILSKDAAELRQALLGTRQTWMQVSDWLDSPAIPQWAIRGEIV
jgi:hypothetical protein